ncbi:MAG: NAD-dependent deacetylase [Treponema sp.]|mgnify:CR=1 FL=1|nr:NAD-dependent deacetylase [Treponema sp.]
MKENIKELVKKIKTAKYCVAFTGAGVSTLSGIQDFRGKDGLYKTLDADRMFDVNLFHSDPSVYYNLAKDFIYGLDEKKPSIVHEVLADLEAKGYIKAVITQNIDLLHTKAGSKTVFEIHGSPLVHRCLSCNKTESFETVAPRARFGKVPLCQSCGNTIKPDIVFFGENLPQDVFAKAVQNASMADLMIVLGSSLIVQPAASLPLYTLKNKGTLVIVNEQSTPLDTYASLRFNDLYNTFSALKSYL